MVTLYEVGGCVRDSLLGLPSKDIDFAVEAASFDDMHDWLTGNGFKIFVESPEYLTIRAHFPTQWPTGLSSRLSEMAASKVTADFVLCRKDDAYSDGRRPDAVEQGTIYDDLARRDFTVNAIARAEDGSLLDPHGGVNDLNLIILRCVGSAEDRLREDALRALRAIRFRVTRGFDWDEELGAAMRSTWLPPLLSSISTERIREELHKMLKADTVRTIDILKRLPYPFFLALMEGGIWLKPTTER